MSATAMPIEGLVSSYRAKGLSRPQLVAALIAAGATAGGAYALVSAVDSSSTTPSPVVSHASHHQLAPAANATQAHQRHVAMQRG